VTNAQTSAAVETVYLQRFADFQSGDSASAFADYSEQCQLELGRPYFNVLFRKEVVNMENFTATKLAADVGLRDVSVEFTPLWVAVWSYLYRKDGTLMSNVAPTPEVMVYEDDQWRFADCRRVK
jgi:hypothetical protein